MKYETIRYEIEANIATVTLCRPERMNAFRAQTVYEMVDALDRVDKDDEVRALVITGEGRAFCAGADLSNPAEAFGTERPDSPLRPDGTVDYSHEGSRDYAGLLTLRLYKCLKPVICAINGAAVGVGVTMTTAMDFRLSSTKARYGFVFTRRGLVPEGASTFFLSRLVGVSKALDWCLSGRIFSAEEALQAGLVRSIHEPEDLLPAAYQLAREIVEHTSPVSVALTRQMIWRGLGMQHPMEAHRVDSWGIFARGLSKDVVEGVDSFLAKRPAHFTDKVSCDMPDFFPWWDDPMYALPKK